MAVPMWAVKAAVTAARNPRETKNAVAKIGGAVLAFILVITAISSGMISAFTGETLDENFDVTQTKLYAKVSGVYPGFVEEMQAEMDELEKKIIEENTYKEWNEEKGEWETKCDITVEKQLSDVSYAYIFAYMTHMDDDLKLGKEIDISKKEIKKFLRSISKVRQKKEEDTYYLYNDVKSPEEVAEMYFAGADEEPMYLISFELYVDFLGGTGIVTEGTELYDSEFAGEILYHSGGVSLPHYFQNDYKAIRYGSGTISSSGCAPTCIAMIVSGLTGQTVTPVDVVKWTGNKYYVSGAGSSWGIFSACASNWGLGCRNLGMNYRAVLQSLEQGKPVVASMRPGTFTRGGHFIVLRGVTSDGYFLVNDPNKNNYKKYGTDKFSCKTVIREAKNFWCFE